ncbi:CpaF family protein [Anaerolineae bacterium CFX7]|nr:CpaF family protein [Anaerolineae bacterium CFX7]
MTSTTVRPTPPTRPYNASALARAVEANLQNAEPGARPYDMVLKLARLKLDEEYAHLKGVKWSLKKDEVRRVVMWALDDFNRKARMQAAHTLEGDLPALVKQLVNDIAGMGFLSDYLEDASVEEIILNGVEQMWVIRASGAKEKVNLLELELDHDRILDQINRLVAPTGRQVNMMNPILNAKLPDGARINVVISPIAEPSPSITIRRHRLVARRMADLLDLNSITPEAAEFVQAAIHARMSILVCGGTGTGKTNFINVLATFFDGDERIVVIEDTRELDLKIEDVQYLTVREDTSESAHPVTQRHLVANALRMRPDRILLGEVRGGEAFDMLMANNTGHEGTITTVHANSATDAITRLLQLCALAEEAQNFNPAYLAEWIARGFHLVIFLGQTRNPPRRFVREIAVLEGRAEGINVTRDLIFSTEQDKLVRSMRPLPERLAQRFVYYGIDPKRFLPRQTKRVDVTPLGRTE